MGRGGGNWGGGRVRGWGRDAAAGAPGGVGRHWRGVAEKCE